MMSHSGEMEYSLAWAAVSGSTVFLDEILRSNLCLYLMPVLPLAMKKVVGAERSVVCVCA